MSNDEPVRPAALVATDVPVRAKRSNYPPVFAARVDGRLKRQLGDQFGLGNFGVNLVVIHPGSISSLHHAHSRQDEFVYVLSGELVLFSGDRQMRLTPGMCAGFKAGGAAHHLENQGSEPATYLEIGDRAADDTVAYPDDDVQATRVGDAWVFTHKDGTSY